MAGDGTLSMYFSVNICLTTMVLRAVSVLRTSLARHNVPRCLARRFSTPSEGVGSSNLRFENAELMKSSLNSLGKLGSTTFISKMGPRWSRLLVTPCR